MNIIYPCPDGSDTDTGKWVWIVYKGLQFDESILENKRGDVNGDGELNISDVTTLIDILLNQ